MALKAKMTDVTGYRSDGSTWTEKLPVVAGKYSLICCSCGGSTGDWCSTDITTDEIIARATSRRELVAKIEDILAAAT
ncbi:hypothetical protein RSWS8N_08540 [Cereibacter sphaeroides WS8N]|uniref:hypothetical protein n=1 Tax=Cereibacter sphaeroides TaxID=1063 RepID=UPI00020DFA51|nr:hypothetical protein [Cereibacter sphaeroides]EGJ22116.1 hypothetical protein RSWS8N_08540 [Cereibacter sphaeroides WS8N]